MRKKLTLETMKEVAFARGGLCVSDEYVNSKSKLQWKCKFGHTWLSTPYSVRSLKTWCPICAQNIPHNLSDLQRVAKDRGGLCLSEKYIGIDKKYMWRCSLGHRFENTFNKVYLRGQWCPTCSKAGISEEVCRLVFSTIFDDNFVKYRPDWLKNERGYQMELDGYSDKLKIAFEYQGRQHSETNFFIKTKKSLSQRVQDDDCKKLLCQKNGIKLFTISHKVNFSDFGSDIERQAIEFGMEVSKYDFNQVIDFAKVYIRKDRIDEIRQMLQSRNSELISSKWLGVKEKYKVRCLIDGNEWYVVGSEIISGAGCKKCAVRKQHDKQKLGISGLKKLALKHGGEVLSKIYTDSKNTYQFRCKNGHTFKSIPNNMIFRKQWCPICEGRRLRRSDEITKGKLDK